MKLYLNENRQAFLLVAAMLGSAVFLFYAGYLERQLHPSGGAYPMSTAGKYAYAAFAFSMASNLAWLVHRRMQRIERAQAWHIEAVNFHIHRLNDEMGKFAEHTHDVTLKSHGHESCAENVEAVDAPLPTKCDVKAGEKLSSRWPWGNHHTSTLGHLEAAAKRFWTLYDTDDIGTAPTNDMVATWLQNERGISKEKARAIASMLRPDGLPTGPRR